MPQQSWEDTYDPLPPYRPEAAKVSVGFTPNGNLAVRIMASRAIELLPGLKEAWQAASAAFLREFSQGEKLLAMVKNAGEVGNPTEQVGLEIAERDGAVKIGYDEVS